MLRSPWSRLPILRQFSTTPSKWNGVQRPSHDAKRGSDQQAPSTLEHRARSESSSSTTTKSSQTYQGPLTAYDLEMVRARIHEWTEQATITLRNSADDFTAKSKTTLSQLGIQLNKVTGYEEIEALKKDVVDQEERINACRLAARIAKKAHEEAVIQRASSQREVNDLLQRKALWTAADVARFTELVPQDHHLQQEEARAKAAADEAEDAVEREFSQLMKVILARYHEEQVWSDKIRSASTYGSLVALGLNMLVFITAILVVEPWKRRRLAQTFEDKITGLSMENEKRLDEGLKVLGDQLDEQKLQFRELNDGLTKNLETKAAASKASTENGSHIMTPTTTDSGSQQFHFSRRELEFAAIGAGAFVAGILSSILFIRT